jgi:FMN phosphatase YigB (HAD superfamily)
MIKAILFDLDGTLLYSDLELFTKHYFSMLREEFKKIGNEDSLFRSLNIAVAKMMKNRGPKSNNDVFWEEFEKLVNIDRNIMEDFFNNFYLEKFPKLKDMVKARPNSYAKEVIKKAFDLGLKVVIATNAVFPLIAIKERLRWAEIDNYNYDLITSMEIMHACKPFPEYYKEILEKIGEKPEKTMMVGNDLQEDLSASSLGIITFLTMDGQILNEDKSRYTPDIIGKMEDLLEILPLLSK